jgi:predicted dinucleotide-binding enzyme
VVVVAIPLRAVPDLPAGVFDGRIVVDANNYYTQRDGQIAAIDDGTTSSRWVADHLAGAHVVKAFNNVYAGHLGAGGKPAGTPGRIALPAAGDDPGAKETVLGLIDELGFDPVDGGPLDESWRQEPGSPVYGTDRDAAGVREGLADAVR